MKTLKPKDIAEQTGWSLYRVLRLINQGRIRATNTGTGSTPRWEVLQCDLDAFFLPKQADLPTPTQAKRRRKPIDAAILEQEAWIKARIANS